MTTNNTAAAWRANFSFAVTSLAVFLGFALAGCSTTGPSLFPVGETAQQQGAPAASTSSTKIAIAPIIGAPEKIATQLQAKLTGSMQSRNIAIASGAGASYTLRGYVVSAREKSGTRVSYIWDVTDTTGKKVNRISGEEIAAASTSKDPWASVNPALMGKISDKVATSLATWLPTQSASAPAIAGAAQAAQASANKVAKNTATAAQKSLQQASATAAGAVTGTTTGSIGGKVNAIVPSVKGAPGDGSVSLTRAIRGELSRSGVALGAAPTPQSYRVEGRVALKQAVKGQQEIKIDWDVKDPKGKTLGTVSQKNSIPAGSLDGSWGKTADAAAAAAAQGILKLLPSKTAKIN